MSLVAAQFRVDVAILVDDDLGDLRRGAFGHADLHAVAHGAADEAAQHVALIDVGGGHAAVVADDEGGGAHVVGDDAEGLGHFLVFAVGLAAQFADLGEDAGEDIRLVDGLRAHQHAVGAFQAHAGIDILLLQGLEGTVGLLVILHEHVVPDLQIAPAGAGGGAIGAAGLLVGDDEHLRVRAAGAGQAGGAPPVVLLGQVEDVVVLDAHLAPEIGGLLVARAVLVAGEHGEGEAVLVDAQPFGAGQKLPAPGNGFLLEVIAQRPVAQHLKEGEVAGVAHVVDVAGADALLHIRQPRAHGVLRAQQIGHQRVHAGGGEQHRGVVFRDQRSAGDDGVVLLLKELQKQAAQVVGAFDVDVHAYLPPDSQKMKRLSRSRTKRRVSRYHPDWPSQGRPTRAR